MSNHPIMAHLFYSSLFIWPLLLMTCFSLKLPSNVMELPKIQHLSKRHDDLIAFLVVGDWGRDGDFNQSRVATQVYLFPAYIYFCIYSQSELQLVDDMKSGRNMLIQQDFG